MRLIVLFVWLFALSAATGGTLTKPDLVKRFPAPLQVGDKDPEIAAWPIFKQNATATELVGYVFESIDLAPIPGFAGVPMNMLVAIDPKGSFIDVAVLSHHEPVFLDGLGEAPLFAFADQYKGLSLKQNIHIDSKTKRLRASDAANAYLDGVSKATASVRILNQSVLSAALKVARKKLGFALGRDPERIARIRTEFFEALSVGEMLDAGLIKRVRLLNRDVEALFAGTAGEGIDSGVPGDVFIDLYLAHVSVPSVGRNLLTEASWNKLRNRLDEGDHAVLVMSSGRYGVIGDDFVRGSVTDRIVLKQGGLPIDMRDLDLDMRLAHAGPLPTQSVTVFRIIGQAGLDAASAQAYALPITRLKGIVYPERITKEINFTYQLPAAYYVASAASDTAWPGIWKERKVELLVLATALAVLSIALAMPKRLTRDGARFGRFRILFLLFTVGFIGYYAQGQLSIVNLTGSIQALLAGRSLEFFLYDPMTVILWGFVLVSLLAWGRGTFCGWLCPFGALQELTGKLGQALRFPQLMLRTAVNGRLKNLKYAVLALILGSAVFAPAMTDMLVELEPFKTAITLNFVRSWPFVAYALALLVMSMFSYKFFCRYLCPFGAALALLGRFRILDWIPRRKECGTPCQSCRYSCEYQAITPAGGVSYDECFQCMDCVVIHESEDKCVPLILEKKRRHSIPIIQGSA
jgi:NosR/NirI family nitrous oxide reductase transcriptional regulator